MAKTLENHPFISKVLVISSKQEVHTLHPLPGDTLTSYHKRVLERCGQDKDLAESMVLRLVGDVAACLVTALQHLEKHVSACQGSSSTTTALCPPCRPSRCLCSSQSGSRRIHHCHAMLLQLAFAKLAALPPLTHTYPLPCPPPPPPRQQDVIHGCLNLDAVTVTKDPETNFIIARLGNFGASRMGGTALCPQARDLATVPPELCTVRVSWGRGMRVQGQGGKGRLCAVVPATRGAAKVSRRSGLQHTQLTTHVPAAASRLKRVMHKSSCGNPD